MIKKELSPEEELLLVDSVTTELELAERARKPKRGEAVTAHPNRIMVMIIFGFGIAAAILPVVANMDWTSTTGIVAGVAAIAVAGNTWLLGWQKHEERLAGIEDDVEDVVDDVTDLPEDLVGGAGDVVAGTAGAVGGVVEGVTGTAGSTLKGVGGVVGGIVGGLPVSPDIDRPSPKKKG